MTQSTTVLQLEAGTHYLCTCGWSKNAPFCNGAHRNSQFQPLVLELDAPKTVEISGAVNTQTTTQKEAP
jgi:CDGSH-type Zn-finger protein